MKNIYSILLLLFLLAAPYAANSQIVKSTAALSVTEDPDSNIEGLYIYPNPVTNGRLYINTHKKLSKEIEIFDVLGKKIITTEIFDKSLDVSQLPSGVYILKIKEGNASATRKLVIR